MSNKAKFKPGYGTHKFGGDFWPGARPNPDEIADRLLEGTSVSIFGLRRIGKSSLIAETRERLRAKGKTVLWIDLQKHDTLAGTLAALLKALAEQKGPVSKIIEWAEKSEYLPPTITAKVTAVIKSKIDSVADSDLDDYSEMLFEQIGTQLAALGTPEKPVIIFDELPLLFYNALKRADASEQQKTVAQLNKFLAILRHWRSDDVGVAMALSGSFSMPWLRREYGIEDEHLNDCDPVEVEEMSREEARGLLEACIASRQPAGWERSCTEQVLDLLPAYYPGVVQLAYGKLRFAADASPGAITDKVGTQIEQALEQTYYIQFDRRFGRYDDGEKGRAAKLFKQLAQAPDATVAFDSAVQLLNPNGSVDDDQGGRELLDFLQSDGFITASRTRGVSYASGLVSAWRSDK